MTKIRNISRFILACFTAVASISLLSVIIYFYADYETNVLINTNIDDYTILFTILMFIFFTGISVLLFTSFFRNLKIQN